MVALGQRRKLLDAQELIDIDDTHFHRIVAGIRLCNDPLRHP